MRSLDCAISDYLDSIEPTELYAKYIYRDCQKTLSLVLFGWKTPPQWKLGLWADSHAPYDDEQRKLIEDTKAIAVNLIDCQGYEPLEATLKALHRVRKVQDTL